MKYRWIALLLALLCGCTVQREIPIETPPATSKPVVEAPAEAPPVVKEENPATETPVTPTERPSAEEEIRPAGDPSATVIVNGKSTKILTNGDTSGCLELKGNTVVEISWPENRSMDRILLEGTDLNGTISISNKDKILYSQELSSDSHWCYIGGQNTDSLTISLTGDTSLSEISVPAPVESSKTKLCAYLPYTYFSDRMLTDGSLAALDELTIHVGCYWKGDGSLEVKDGLTDVISKIRTAYPQLKIYCTINPKAGGAAAITSLEKRNILIENMIRFCQEQQLNGVDIDWEFPAEDQWDDFSALLSQLGNELDGLDMKLSAAFYPENITLSSNAVAALSKVNVMAYDLFDENGFHSTYQSAVDSIRYFLDMGFSPRQLSLGIPAYGRPLSGEAQWPYYCDFADQLIDGSSLLGNNYFNSPQLAQDKTVLAEESELHSVFLYHLGSDLPGSDSRSLSAAIRQVIEK